MPNQRGEANVKARVEAPERTYVPMINDRKTNSSETGP